MCAAAEAGKHIFTEKLLAPTVAEGRRSSRRPTPPASRSSCRSRGSTTAPPARWTTCWPAGALGRLTYGRVRLSHDGAVAGWLPERFFDPRAAIGGALTDLGCHPVYLIQRFLGAEPDTVSATYRSLTGRAVEDHAVVTAGYADGRIGVIEAGFVSAAPFTIELHGTDASLLYSDADGALRVSGGEGWTELPVPADGEDAFAQWVGHIRAGTRADDNLARAAELTRLVVAANEAAATGRTVAYP